MTSDATDFLYPFIESNERDAGSLLLDLARSAEGKAALSHRLTVDTLDQLDGEIEAAATTMAECFGGGGRLFTFGNGGSSTDAVTVAALFSAPPWGSGLPARSLVADAAVLTALGNDIGFDVVFSRQVIAHGRQGDIALGLSTSGNSDNVIAAFAEARRRGIRTIGLAGYEGGQMATCGHVDWCLVVRSDSVHRIQEAQAAVAFELWRRVSAKVQPASEPPR